MSRKVKSIFAVFMAVCMIITMSSTSLFVVVADAIEESKIEQVQNLEEVNQQTSETVKQETDQENTDKSQSAATEAQQQDLEESSTEEKVEDQITIKVPKGATLFVGTKTAHYAAFKEVKPDRDPTTEDGVTTYAFNRLSSDQVYNLRVSMEDKVTYCDYFKPTQGTEFTFRTTEDSENPDSDTVVTLKDDSSQVLRNSVNSYGADIYMNVGSTGQKNLKVGEEFKLRNYRVWQNITDGINNYFFEPDFHYEIISGSDVISYNQETSKITALKEGTAIVKITYDAQETTSLGYTKVKSTLATPSERKMTSAIWPENVGLFVVNVGSNGEVETGIDWDAEHDSYYYVNSFNGEKTGQTNTQYTFEPEEGSTVTVLRPTLNDEKTSVSYATTFSSDGVSTKDGKVTVTLNHGRNIIKVEKDGKASYQVITARPLDLTMQDSDGNQIDTAKPGQKVKIIYNGISTPVYKMSGIYNPNTNYIEYSSGATGDNAGQYLTGKMNLNVTIPAGIEENTYTVSGTGKICVTIWGDNIGKGHRENIGDDGRQPNLDAGGDTGKFSVLPEISIPVDTDVVERQVATFNNFPENGYVIITDSTSSTKYTRNTMKLPAGEYSYTVGAKGYKPQKGTFTVAEEAVNITLKDMEAASSDSAWDGVELSEPEKKDGVYQIKTGAELAWFANSVTKGNQNAKALLLNDVDLAGYDWTPIGEFYGSFDGGNHTIKNLYVKNASSSSALFSYLGVGGIIKNLTVNGDVITDTVSGSDLYTNINSKRLFYTSGIVARTEFSTIENCCNDVDVTVAGEIAGGVVYQTTTIYIGGVAGQIYNSSVKNCTNKGDINVTASATYTNTNSGVGGVIGRVGAASTIKNCGNEGNVTSLALGQNGSPYSLAVGGVFGLYSYSYDIENCYNKGTVKSNSSYAIGGISGFIGGGGCTWVDPNGQSVTEAFSSKINNCYNTGDIIGTNTSASTIGGIVGNAYISGMKNTYTTGKVETASTNTNKVGLFIGTRSIANCDSSDYINNYYKPQNNLNVIGTNDDANISRTEIVDESTVQSLIQADNSTYCGYDGIYPVLYWELSNITELKVVKQPNKLNYYLNTSLDIDGMMLEATDSSGKVYSLNGNVVTFSPDKFETSGKQAVTISFAGKQVEIDVNVYEEGKNAEFTKLPEVDENTTNVITIQKGTGIHNLVFEADGKGEVEYKLYRAKDINSDFESVSFTKNKRQLILPFNSYSVNAYLYKVQATIGEEVIETQTYLLQVVDKEAQCSINYEQPENGKFELIDIAGNTIKSGTKVPAGKKALSVLTIDEGYAISKYQINDEDADYKGTATISKDTTFSVKYGKERTVTFEATSKDENNITKGTVSVKNSGTTISSGDKVGEGATITVTSNSDGSGNTWYLVDSINTNAIFKESITDTYGTKQNTYTVSDKDVNIEVEYVLGAQVTMNSVSYVQYDYSYDDVVETNKNGVILCLPAGKQIKVTPKSTSSNYQITKMNFIVSGADTNSTAVIGDDYSATFTTVAGSTYTLYPTNTRLYTPSIRITGKGSIQILNEAGEEITKFMLNSNIIVNAIPEDGYKLSSLKNGSKTITSGTVFKVTSNSFRVTFVKDETKWSKVTFDADNGQDSVVKEIKKDQSLDYTPETPVKEGYTFVGWYKDTDDITTEYKNNQSYAEDTTYKAKWAHVEMLGAQGKLVVDDKSGIRFGTKIYTDGDEIVQKGTLIIPEGLLDEGEALTLNTPKAVKSIAKVNYEVNKDENYITYLGTLVNIQKAQFEVKITASSYVIYKDKVGNEYTVYSPYKNKSISVFDLLGNNVSWKEDWENL